MGIITVWDDWGLSWSGPGTLSTDEHGNFVVLIDGDPNEAIRFWVETVTRVEVK